MAVYPYCGCEKNLKTFLCSQLHYYYLASVVSLTCAFCDSIQLELPRRRKGAKQHAKRLWHFMS